MMADRHNTTFATQLTPVVPGTSIMTYLKCNCVRHLSIYCDHGPMIMSIQLIYFLSPYKGWLHFVTPQLSTSMNLATSVCKLIRILSFSFQTVCKKVG